MWRSLLDTIDRIYRILAKLEEEEEEEVNQEEEEIHIFQPDNKYDRMCHGQ